MEFLHSAAAVLIVIALVLTLISGVTNPSKLPLWVAVLVGFIAVLVLAIPGR
jgi:hypothetical protein